MVEEPYPAKYVDSGSDTTVNVENEEDDLVKIPSIYDLSIDKLPFWSEISKSKITVKLLDKTSTNRVYKVDIWNNSGSSVVESLLVKKFIILGTAINDADTQIQIFERLGKYELGPRIFYRSDDILIQRYIEGSSLGCYSFSKVSTLVTLASSLAKFHRVATAIADPDWDKTPILFKNVENWIPYAKKVVKEFNDFVDIEKLIGYFNEFRGIFDAHLSNSNSHSNVIVFCHNDLYCKNILDTPNGIHLIDYDYSGFNYVGSDVSQIFNQVHVTYDEDDKKTVEYQTEHLTHEMKTIFSSVYLSEALGLSGMPPKELIEEFITSLRVHTLGLAVFWAFAGIMLVKTAKSTWTLPKEYYMHFSRIFCSLYEKTLEELTSLGIVN